MQKIRLLDSKTINKIAAGEVVESPRSVVKELAENAIDAGASSVTIEIREGGTSFIRVTDNGCGIPKEQAAQAFLRHATSKLSQIEDLENIFTLGFRGEALASIAAVSQVELLTKTAEETTGTELHISGGEIEKNKDAACREGTSITVKNLFYNVPARKNFLKKPAAESAHISDLVNKLALGHPEVAICYINNGATILHTSGNNDRKTSVFYVYGKKAAESMLPLSHRKGELSLNGLIAKPEFCRANRSYENLFINGRPIKNAIVSSAVEDAYKTKLMIGKFPVFVLNLEIPPACVDVNVHPAKLEVRFKNDEEIYELFYTAVLNVLQETVLIPKAELAKPEKKAEKMPEPEQSALPFFAEEAPLRTETAIKAEAPVKTEAPVFREPPKAEDFSGGKTVDQLLKKNADAAGVSQERVPYEVKKTASPAKEQPLPDVPSESPLPEPLPAEETPAPAEVRTAQEDFSVEEAPQKKREPFFKQYRIIGQVFRTYWIVEQGNSLYLIDQHAAHERILYEELMEKFRSEKIISQRLLTPLMLRLTPSETLTLTDNRELLESFGFELEQFGDTYALRSVPHLLKEPDSIGFFTEILDRLSEEHIKNLYDTKILAVATMACKAAVKGNDSLSFQEAEALISRLLKLENPFTCPHGRPTILSLTQYELEKMFKRIQD